MAKTRRSKGSPPDRMETSDLIDGCHHEMWTAAAAIFVLHGRTPPDFESENAELAAQFPEANKCVEDTVGAGEIAYEIATPDGPRWVDSPARWYAWAKDKGLDLDPRVGEHFDAVSENSPQGPESPVHYLNVRKLLGNRLGATPEEIAVWIFLGELEAWTTRDKVQTRFRLQWFEGWSYDYVSQITDTVFSREQIESFEPKQRFLSYSQLIARWAPIATETEAKLLIEARHAEDELWPLNPLTGLTPLSEPPPIAERVFLLSEIEAIEAQSGFQIGADVPQGSNAVLKKLIAPPSLATTAASQAVELAMRELVIRDYRIPTADEVLAHIEGSKGKYKLKSRVENKLTWQGKRGAYSRTYRTFQNSVAAQKRRWLELNPHMKDS